MAEQESRPGDWHYREAERLLAGSRQVPLRKVEGQPGKFEDDPESTYYVTGEEHVQAIAAAQVHATLALAAATVDAAHVVHVPGDPIRGERPRVLLAHDRLGEGFGR